LLTSKKRLTVNKEMIMTMIMTIAPSIAVQQITVGLPSVGLRSVQPIQ